MSVSVILLVTKPEGTIQFAYQLDPPGDPVEPEILAQLAAWRSIFRQLEILGHHPDRYDGFGYGNLSMKDSDESFIITASQTSGESELTQENLVRITGCNLDRFWVDASGHQPPSSETLTHAMIYQADSRVQWVFHVHSPELWNAALDLPETPPDVPYGSPQMAEAVNELLSRNVSRPLVFATRGHEDGIFVLGSNARDCGGLLVTYLAKARALSQVTA